MGSATLDAQRLTGPVARARRRRSARPSLALRDSAQTIRRRVHHRARMALACALLALVGAATALLWPSFGLATRSALALVAIITAAFYGLSWSLARPGAPSESRTWPLVASAVEVSLATTILCVVALLESPVLVAAGVGSGAYFLALAIAATRMRPGVVLAATGLALAQWIAVDLLLVRPALAGVALEEPGTGWLWTRERFGWLAGVGVIAAGSALALAERTRMVGDRMERRLERELGRYVSRGVARAILRGEVNLGEPERRRVTVLFCDLRGFTFLCERERPEDVVEILETFYQRAFAIVEANGGTVNKILGDGLLALFNAPDDLPDHAAAAADAAGSIMRMVHRLRERGGVWTHVAVGIGLDTGDIVVGALGSFDRAEYTAIGSPVNRAARLQSLGDREGRRIVVSEATRRALGGQRHIELLGEVELKGFAAPERVYYLPFRRPRGSGLYPDLHQSDMTLRRVAVAPAGELDDSTDPGEPPTAPG